MMKTLNKFLLGLVVFAMVSLMTACSENDSDQLNDAEIASIAVTANQIDVRYGELALEKSQNPDVRHFAEAMIKDHNSIIAQAAELAQKLGVTPQDNPVTQSLLSGEKEMMAKLSSLDGLAFDKAYIQNEEDYHDAVIKAVNETLIPSTQNEELKNLLIKVGPLLNGHLDMAKESNAAIQGIPELDDAQIASIAVVANQIDVRYGKIALSKSSDKDVTHFANSMIRDHENIIGQAVELAGRLGVTPDDDNPITQSLLAGEKETTDKLNSLTGEEFNKAYIDNEVAFHDAVIGAVKSILIPYTDNSELKETLIKVSPLLNEHLKMAKQAQKARS